jgi:hypothetical protein
MLVTLLLIVALVRCTESFEPLRFLRQVTFFNKIPLPFVNRGRSTSMNAGTVLSKGDTLWSPSHQNGLAWGPLDDVVMGGQSASSIDSRGKWKAVVTTEGGGGFVGVRTKVFGPVDASACDGIALQVRGNSAGEATTEVKLIVRDSEEWNGVAWTTIFKASGNGELTTVRVPWRSFTPTKRAKRLDGLAINPATLRAVQLTFSKFSFDGGLNPTFKEGRFEMDIVDVSTY